MKVVECVPNFSEGRDRKTIESIAEAISSSPGVVLLDFDPGYDTNRTLYSFVGEPERILTAACNAVKRGTELIDMRSHNGAHPRIGACDVCPFIPVSRVDMNECVELAKKLGKFVGEKLNIPVYLYEHAATSPGRKNLEHIRSGQYEGLREKLNNPKWKPDYGPEEFNEQVQKTGATVIGARDFLIAYNININTKDRARADEIAKAIREKGETVINEEGTRLHVAGTLKHCKAIGWYVDEYKRAQVSINLTNYHVTNLHHAFEAASEEAKKHGTRVTGSEIVGLVPKKAIIDAGLYYLKKQGRTRALPEKDIITAAVQTLGLSELSPFQPDKKIIEYRIRSKDLLAALSLEDLTDELASKSQAPGGGSVSALAGAIAASLASMIGNLTYKKKNYQEVWSESEEIAASCFRMKDRFLELIDEDTKAFTRYMSIVTQKKKPDTNKGKENRALSEALEETIQVPYEMMKLSQKLLPLLEKMIKIGNTNTFSEMAISAHMIKTALHGAHYNILLNLKELTDVHLKNRLIEETQNIVKEADPVLHTVIDGLEKKMNPHRDVGL
jgi:glutamate formiminotransferase/formiminotetrahydrofolate cyclodeaminase